MSTASPDEKTPFERIVRWIGKLSAGSAMAVITLATIQEVVLDVGVQGLTGAIRKALSGLFGDAVIGPAIDRWLGTGGEAIPEELQTELVRLEELLRQQDVRHDVADLLRQQDAIARVTGTALQMHEDSAVQRIAEAVAYQTWAAADDVVRRVGDKLQQALQDAGLQDLHATVQAMMALLQRERELTIQVQQTLQDVRVEGSLAQVGHVGGNMVFQADTLTVMVAAGEDPAKAQRLADLKRRYLTRLAEQVGRLYLSQINPDAPEGVYLERIYVDSPTKLAISVEIQDWRIVEWNLAPSRPPGPDEDPVFYMPSPDHLEEWGYDITALQELVDDIQKYIDTVHEENPDERWLFWKGQLLQKSSTIRETLVLQDIAAARNRLVVLGGPGSGKSTFVKHLALCLAGEQLDWQREARLEHIRRWPHGALTPVYVELRRFVGSKHFPEAPTLPTVDEHLWPYICDKILGADLAEYAGSLLLELEHGQAVLILDGLDEVPYDEGQLAERQQQLQALAHSIDDRYGSSRVIVASRPYAYEGWRLQEFQMVEIADFENEHRLELATRLYREAGQEPEAALELARQLVEELQPVDRELKDRPLFLTLMATVFLYEGGGLPTNKGTLYRKSILLLLDRWVEGKPGVKTLADILGVTGLEKEARVKAIYERLAALAYEVHALGGGRNNHLPEITEEQLYKYLKPLGRHLAVELIRYLSENAGVLVSPGQNGEKDVFRFAHRSFQEYLAASHLVTQCQLVSSYDQVRGHIEDKPQTWREPCTLVGDVLVDSERGSDLWALVDHLLGEDDEPEALSVDSPRWWAAWLAAQLVEEHEILRHKPGRGEWAIRDALVTWLRQVVERAGILAPPERAVCGRSLGALGDPRPGVAEFKEGLPEFDWVRIEGGPFIYQKNEQREVAPFQMARYPVTVAQFAPFVEGDGYQNREYWTKAGWQQKEKDGWTEPRYWNDPPWHIANHPVVGVSWYEAIAYCKWLTAALGYAVTLPTEEQWERAARGREGREYPWGEGYLSGYANIDETYGDAGPHYLQRTTAVGLYPQGATAEPERLLDLSGNVWEWCLNDDDEPATKDMENTASRVVRGGSWDSGSGNARAVARYDWSPNSWGSDIGFRVVVAAPTQSCTV